MRDGTHQEARSATAPADQGRVDQGAREVTDILLPAGVEGRYSGNARTDGTLGQAAERRAGLLRERVARVALGEVTHEYPSRPPRREASAKRTP